VVLCIGEVSSEGPRSDERRYCALADTGDGMPRSFCRKLAGDITNKGLDISRNCI
jgi:hypothetical protein